ncbi:MAG: ABC transporter permease [Actinomycetota bacterium]|nr:ABC transporter permease [Actinomycetota bacterium]
MTSLETAAFETAEGAEHLSARGDVRRGLLRRLWRERTGRVALLIVAAFALAAVLAPVLAPHDPNAVDVARKFEPPSDEFLLGTDHLGRDVLSRLLFGARVSVATTLVAASLISLIGLVLGMLAGYLGGVADTVIGRVMDVVLAFPSLLLALAVTGILGPGLRNVTIAVVVVWWAEYARLVRSAVIVVREKPYIEAARALGASRTRILGRHVLPNIVAPIVVRTTLELGLVLLGIAALSFLGLGVKPPAAEWGSMLSEGRTYLSQAPQMMLFPGAAIFLLVLGFNLLGDGLRDVLDPRTRGEHG